MTTEVESIENKRVEPSGFRHWVSTVIITASFGWTGWAAYSENHVVRLSDQFDIFPGTTWEIHKVQIAILLAALFIMMGHVRASHKETGRWAPGIIAAIILYPFLVLPATGLWFLGM